MNAIAGILIVIALFELPVGVQAEGDDAGDDGLVAIYCGGQEHEKNCISR